MTYPVPPKDWRGQVLYYGEDALSLGQDRKWNLITDYFAPEAMQLQQRQQNELQPRLRELAEFSYRELAGLEDSAGITGE